VDQNRDYAYIVVYDRALHKTYIGGVFVENNSWEQDSWSVFTDHPDSVKARIDADDTWPETWYWCHIPSE